MPLIEEIEDDTLLADDDEDLGPGIDPYEKFARLEHSRIAGDYYRDLSLHYADYEVSGLWPEHPYPNEKHTYNTIF